VTTVGDTVIDGVMVGVTEMVGVTVGVAEIVGVTDGVGGIVGKSQSAQTAYPTWFLYPNCCCFLNKENEFSRLLLRSENQPFNPNTPLPSVESESPVRAILADADVMVVTPSVTTT
jgi:hypothetical protein